MTTHDTPFDEAQPFLQLLADILNRLIHEQLEDQSTEGMIDELPTTGE